MLKRIHIQHLTLGMYLQEFCGSWMDHPFWRAKFLLKDPKDLARIQATAIQEIWIDTDKGLDVAEGTASMSREEVDAQIETDFSRLEELPPVKVKLPSPPPPPKRDRKPADMHSELKMAAAICVKSKEAVVSMFHEARMGRAVDSAGAQSLVEEISDSVTRNPGALISLARLKTADDYTYMHSVAVCALMVALAKQLKLKEDQQRLAGMAACCTTWARRPFRWPCSTSPASSPTRNSPWCAATRWRAITCSRRAATCPMRCWTPACTTTKRWTDRATPTSWRAKASA